MNTARPEAVKQIPKTGAPASRSLVLGYLVPEFPGQTHNFFWREIHALRALGIRADIVSTRRPPTGVRSTSWRNEAEKATTYLYPLTAAEVPAVLLAFLSAGPLAWFRCFTGICKAKVTMVMRFRMFGLMLMAAKLVVTARRGGWKHVHVHSCADAAHVALLAKWLGGIEYSMTLHNALAIGGPNQRQKWCHALFCIVINQALSKEVRASLQPDLPPRIEIAPMGVDVSVFRRDGVYQPYNGQGELRVFSCSRLNEGKGHRFLIEAVHKLTCDGVAVRLQIAGEDDHGGSGHRRELEALIKSFALGNCVTLLGAVAEEVVRKHLMHAHVFVLASLDEALGVAIMEAMSMKVPVVATKVGGVAELVSDGIDGILVASGNPDAIAHAVRAIATNPETARRLSAQSRKKIIAQFTSGRSAAAIARLTGLASQGENHD
jgi:glycosyltransferase involved in cell wall biosynthesis